MGIKVLAVLDFGTGRGMATGIKIVSGRLMISFSAVTPTCREIETCPLQRVISISRTFTEITCLRLLANMLAYKTPDSLLESRAKNTFMQKSSEHLVRR